MLHTNEINVFLSRAFYDLHSARRNKTLNKQKTHLLEAVKDCIAMRNPIFEDDDQQVGVVSIYYIDNHGLI